jgi:putative ABC transport system permease protein
MLAVAVLLSVFAGLGFGLAPARAAFQLGAGKHYNRSGLRNVLVSTQIAVALVLLIASGLMANSLMRLAGSDLNFDPNGMLSFDFRLPAGQYMRDVGSYHGAPYAEVHPPSVKLNNVYEKLRAIPGVETVAGSSFPPVDSLVLPTMGFTIEDRPAPATEADRAGLNAVYFLVTPKFFSSMKTPILRGREFTSTDTEAAQWVAVVNETMARQIWPGEDPIGKHISLDVVAGERPREIVGVVRDIPLRRVYEPRPVLYVSFLQQSDQYQGPLGNMFGQMTFLIRTNGEPKNLLPAARRAIAEVEPGRPLASIIMMNDLLGAPIQDRRRMVLLIAVLAAVATVLAAIGIYGVMSYTVEQRTREIGIRMALGASVGEILRSVGWQALLLIGLGLAAGLAGSLAITRFLSYQLWGVSPTDPATFGSVTLLLVLVALIACFVPARRALRVDPTVALRSE